MKFNALDTNQSMTLVKNCTTDSICSIHTRKLMSSFLWFSVHRKMNALKESTESIVEHTHFFYHTLDLLLFFSSLRFHSVTTLSELFSDAFSFSINSPLSKTHSTCRQIERRKKWNDGENNIAFGGGVVVCVRTLAFVFNRQTRHHTHGIGTVLRLLPSRFDGYVLAFWAWACVGAYLLCLLWS